MPNPNRWEISRSIEFSKEDLKDLRTTLQIVGDVARTHYGLGLRTAFSIAAVLGYCSLLQVGDKGIGKTTTIRAIERWVRKSKTAGKMKTVELWSKEQTMAGADADMNETFSHHQVLWVSHDLAKLSPEVQKGMFKVVSAVSQDRSCTVKTSLYDCDITDCDLSWLSAIAYDLYEQVWQIPEWRGSHVDRIMRYFCFPYRNEVCFELPHIPMFNNSSMATLSKDEGYWKIVRVLENQFGEERAQDYGQRIMRGLARQNGRRITTEADSKFLLLFKANIVAEKLIGSREFYTAPMIIDTDALFILSECLKHKKVNIPEFAKKWKVEDGERIAREVAEDCPFFFKRYGNIIIANPTFVNENIKPQKEFETRCLNLFQRKNQ